MFGRTHKRLLKCIRFYSDFWVLDKRTQCKIQTFKIKLLRTYKQLEKTTIIIEHC